MKNIITFGFLVLLVFTACSSAEDVSLAVETSDVVEISWIEYVDEDLGFKFSYPDSYVNYEGCEVSYRVEGPIDGVTSLYPLVCADGHSWPHYEVFVALVGSASDAESVLSDYCGQGVYFVHEMNDGITTYFSQADDVDVLANSNCFGVVGVYVEDKGLIYAARNPKTGGAGAMMTEDGEFLDFQVHHSFELLD